MKKQILISAIILLFSLMIQAEDLKEISWDKANIKSVSLMLENPRQNDDLQLLIRFVKPVNGLDGLIYRYSHSSQTVPLDYSNICEQIKAGVITGAIYDPVGGDRYTGLPKISKVKNIRGFIY